MIFESEALSRCVGCGLCLPACPTFQVTHREEHGPRGRIAGMRLVQRGEVPAGDADYIESMETCVQCRACEVACPSAVEFGALMERAREMVETAPAAAPARREGGARRVLVGLALRSFGSRPLLWTLSLLLSVAQLLRLDRLLPRPMRVAQRVRLRDLFRPVRSVHGGGPPAYLFRGCVMDAWFRPVHRATARLLAAAGRDVRVRPAPACCGAMDLHTGRTERAKRLAQRVVDAYRGTTGEIVVNSAGCVAALREYGRLLGTPEAEAFAARIRDVTEAVRPEELPALEPLDMKVAYQAACHLLNVQGVDSEVDALLAAVPSLQVERPLDGELCCGAGGAYSLLQPEFAARMRERKREALAETGATVVVSGNPGCVLHLKGAGVPMLHTAELLASALPDEPERARESS